jgi:hypothetical protein
MCVGLVLLFASGAFGTVVLQLGMTYSTSGAATPNALTNNAANVVAGCGTSTVTVTLRAGNAGASVAISIPAGCRGRALNFLEPVLFTASANMDGEVSLFSNAWTANMGRVQVCLAPSGAGCRTNTITLRSTTAPPSVTNIRGLTAGRAYGLRITTHLAAPGGTATIALTEDLIHLNAASGAEAFVQQDQIDLTIVQH